LKSKLVQRKQGKSHAGVGGFTVERFVCVGREGGYINRLESEGEKNRKGSVVGLQSETHYTRKNSSGVNLIEG